jgi:hypothetical protein
MVLPFSGTSRTRTDHITGYTDDLRPVNGRGKGIAASILAATEVRAMVTLTAAPSVAGKGNGNKAG